LFTKDDGVLIHLTGIGSRIANQGAVTEIPIFQGGAVIIGCTTAIGNVASLTASRAALIVVGTGIPIIAVQAIFNGDFFARPGGWVALAEGADIFCFFTQDHRIWIHPTAAFRADQGSIAEVSIFKLSTIFRGFASTIIAWKSRAAATFTEIREGTGISVVAIT